LDFTYKINKYCVLLLTFGGVTSTELTFSVPFVHMMFEKEYNVVINYQDNTLMNIVDIVFLKDTTMLCEYYIAKNVIAKCKTYSKVKDFKDNDGKKMKFIDIVKTVMDAWEAIVNFDTNQEFVDKCNRFKILRETVIL